MLAVADFRQHARCHRSSRYANLGRTIVQEPNAADFGDEHRVAPWRALVHSEYLPGSVIPDEARERAIEDIRNGLEDSSRLDAARDTLERLGVPGFDARFVERLGDGWRDLDRVEREEAVDVACHVAAAEVLEPRVWACEADSALLGQMAHKARAWLLDDHGISESRQTCDDLLVPKIFDIAARSILLYRERQRHYAHKPQSRAFLIGRKFTRVENWLNSKSRQAASWWAEERRRRDDTWSWSGR